jgi:hypothetical protein
LSNFEKLQNLVPREKGKKGIIMKKVIDGKKYETETATLIGNLSAHYSPTLD